jgi:HPt (histidine-containing phosphotransfer) domain-containing protein
MIDWKRVRELREEIGSDAFEEVLDLFLEEVESALVMLRCTSEAQGIEAQLHFLKGSALNIGFEALAEMCEENERKARAGGAANVRVTEVITGYEASKAVFLAGISEGIPA